MTEQPTGRPVKVAVFDERGELLWERTSWPAAGGLTARDYLSDGTQQLIVNELNGAFEQASFELGSYDPDAVLDASAAAAQVDNDVPKA